MDKKRVITITGIGTAIFILCGGFALITKDPASNLSESVGTYIEADKDASCVDEVFKLKKITQKDLDRVDNLEYYLTISEELKKYHKLDDIELTSDDIENAELLSPLEITDLMLQEKDNTKYRDVDELRKQLAIQEALVNEEIYDCGYNTLKEVAEYTLKSILLDVNKQDEEYIDYVTIAPFKTYNNCILEKKITSNPEQPLYTAKRNTNIARLYEYVNYLDHKTTSLEEVDGELETYSSDTEARRKYNKDRNRIVRSAIKYVKNAIYDEYGLRNNLLDDSREIIKINHQSEKSTEEKPKSQGKTKKK